MKRLLPYYSLLLEVRWMFFCSMLCGLISGAASGFGLPLMLRKVLPVLFSASGTPEDLVLFDPATTSFAGISFAGLPAIVIPAEHVLLFAVMLLPVVFIVRGVAMFGNMYLLNVCGIRVLEGVRMRLFRRLQELHLGFFNKHNSGDLLSRTMNDTMLVKNSIVEATNDLIIQPFTLIAAVSFVIWQAVKNPATMQFLLCLLLVPATVLPIRVIGRRLEKRSRSALQMAGELSGVLTESLQSPREIRSYNLQERECNRFQSFVRKYLRLQLKVVKYDKAITPSIEIVSACTISFAVYRAAGVGLDIDAVVALVGALYFAYEPIKKIGKVNNRLREGRSALARMEEVINTENEVPDPENPKPLGTCRGDVEFENVSFRYDPDEPVLKNISFSVKAGETVALVGPSGAGKSTVANLIPRFYDVQIGAVKIDGNDVRELAQNEIRQNIAMVSQEPILFSDTIYNNVLLGKPDATREEVEEALRRASAAEFVAKLENGEETVVGERGGRLSGGQRQRIAIARAFLKDAPILILDEATSALDSESEAEIQNALSELVKGRTTFMIAHRFSSLRTATRILVFDKGEIVADGTPEQVYANSALYRELRDKQLSEMKGLSTTVATTKQPATVQ